MKKTYISPKAKSIELHFEGLIAESLEGGGLDGGTPGDEFDPNAPTYSNRRGIWGDTEW